MLLDSNLEPLAIFSRLKILDIRPDWRLSAEMVLSASDLKQLRQIKILRVTNVVLMSVPPNTTLPLFSTLREIYLKNAPTKWVSGHVFMNLATLSIVIQAEYQGFHFNAGLGRNTFPCLRTIRLLQSSWMLEGRGQKRLDQLVYMIWGAVEVRKTESEEDGCHVFCAEALSSV
jgi:hypothetical protein